MNLMKYNPIMKRNDWLFDDMQRQVGRWFDDFGKSVEWPMIRPMDLEPVGFTPNVNVKETDNDVFVTADLPGLEEKDIDITLERDTLVLKGERKAEKEEKKLNWYRLERTYGAFQRTIPLPCEVKGEKVDAKFRNGVLSIVLPKAEEAKHHTRKISVRTEK